LGKHKTADHRANISMAKVQVDKWIDNLARAKTFIDTEGRMPSQRAGDADERFLGKWITKNKIKDRGTNSNREQLMMLEIPLAFDSSRVQFEMDKWMDNLAKAKTFIDTEGRMPSQRAGDAEERHRGQWIASNKKKERGTNSEREKLMRREIPRAFA
jgi:hypothetical protein